MHEGVLLKSSIAQFWTELKTVTSLLWGEPSSIKSTWKCGSCSSAERAATWSEAERGQESANSALAAFRKQQQQQQPRVHRIVMDYVQGLKSVSRAKNELTTSWRKGRSWKWVPRDTNSSNKLDLIVGGSSSVGEHHVTTPAMPWWSWLSHLFTAQSRCGRIERNTNEKARLRFLLSASPKSCLAAVTGMKDKAAYLFLVITNSRFLKLCCS